MESDRTVPLFATSGVHMTARNSFAKFTPHLSFQILNKAGLEVHFLSSYSLWKEGVPAVVKAVYPGSFDPVTNGHVDIIDRASKVFDHLIVAVLENPRKTPLFSIEERVRMLNQITEDYPNVEVDYYRGLLIEYSRKRGANIIIKGLRAISDFEFEFQMALVNRKLDCDVETLFMMTNNKYSYISSSIVKEVASYGGEIKDLVPAEVYACIMEKITVLKT